MPPAVYGATEPWNGGKSGDTANVCRANASIARSTGIATMRANAVARTILIPIR
jgi:hypothetical protein